MTDKEFLLEAVNRAIAMSGGVEAFDEMPKPMSGVGKGGSGGGGADKGGSFGGGGNDGDGKEATLEEHDKRWHKDGYKGGSCRWREKHGIPTTDPNGGNNPDAKNAAKEAVKGTNINPDNVAEVWTPGQKPQVIQQPEGELKKTQGALGDLKSQKSAANVEKLEQLNAQADTPQKKTLIQQIYGRLKDKLANLGNNANPNGGGEGATAQQQGQGQTQQQPQGEARYEREEDIPYLDDISDEDYDKLSPTQEKQIDEKEDKRIAEESEKDDKALEKEYAEKDKKDEAEHKKRMKAMDKKIAAQRKKLVTKQVGIMRENERKKFRKEYDDEFKSIQKRVKSGEITRKQGDRLQKKAEDKYFDAHDKWSAKKDDDYSAEANKHVSEMLAKQYQPKPPKEGAKPASEARQKFQEALGKSHKGAAERAGGATAAQKPSEQKPTAEAGGDKGDDILHMSQEEFDKLPDDQKRTKYMEYLQKAHGLKGFASDTETPDFDKISPEEYKKLNPLQQMQVTEKYHKAMAEAHKPKPEAAKIKPYKPQWAGKPLAKQPSPLRKKLGDALQRWGKSLSDMGEGKVQHTYRDLVVKHRMEMAAKGIDIPPPKHWSVKDLMADKQNDITEQKFGAEADRRLNEGQQPQGQTNAQPQPKQPKPKPTSQPSGQGGGAANKGSGLTLHKNSLFGEIKNLDNPDVMGMALDIEKEYNEAKASRDRKKMMSLMKEWKALQAQMGGSDNEGDEEKKWREMADKGVRTQTHYSGPDMS